MGPSVAGAPPSPPGRWDKGLRRPAEQSGRIETEDAGRISPRSFSQMDVAQSFSPCPATLPRPVASPGPRRLHVQVVAVQPPLIGAAALEPHGRIPRADQAVAGGGLADH